MFSIQGARSAATFKNGLGDKLNIDKKDIHNDPDRRLVAAHSSEGWAVYPIRGTYGSNQAKRGGFWKVLTIDINNDIINASNNNIDKMEGIAWGK